MPEKEKIDFLRNAGISFPLSEKVHNCGAFPLSNLPAVKECFI